MNTSPLHKEPLMRILDATHVSKDIDPKSLENMIGSIMAPQAITFSEEELPLEGGNHNRSMNIIIVYTDYQIPLVLVDNGFALNVCPLRMMTRLGIDPSSLKKTTQGVRTFDNTRRDVMGELELQFTINPMSFLVTFQVLNIQPTFNLLLG